MSDSGFSIKPITILILGLALAAFVYFGFVPRDDAQPADNRQEVRVENQVDEAAEVPGVVPAEEVVIEESAEEVVYTGVAARIRPITQADHIQGDFDAPVTIIKYSDLECPFCQRLHDSLGQLREVRGQDFRLVYRNFPLKIHAHAFEKAVAAECAHEQGKYWEFVDAVFDRGTGLAVSRLPEVPDEVQRMVTKDMKSEVLEPYYSRYERVHFIDDKPENIEDVKGSFPDVQAYYMRRPEDMPYGNEEPQCNCEHEEVSGLDFTITPLAT